VQPTTIRARSREQRHARIERVALELFRSRGFDRVTVEDVCAAAAVAPATFYRHFGSKEEVVFSYQDQFGEALRRAVRPRGDPGGPARLTVVLQRFAEYLESQRDVLALRDEIVLGHPRLLQRTLLVQRDLEALLAEELAHSRGLARADVADHLEAGLGVLVLRAALRQWRAKGGSSLPRVLAAVLADVAGLARHLAEESGSVDAPVPW
jgi:AcrR family transcriptional regulator